MVKSKLSNKTKGIFRVSASNLLSLAISMLTSFVLPYFISVEEYGYWQLFVLYCGYVGFFVLGFNDGIHLNYATESYTERLAAKFHTFKTFLLVLSGLESLFLLGLLILCSQSYDKNFWIFLFVILNILPQALIGMFLYMNQATMRYKYYAVGCVVDKIVFAAIMVLMLSLKAANSVYYIAAYTISRYCVIGYFAITCREVFSSVPQPYKSVRLEVKNNFLAGFPLMIATVLNGSIIVGSRFLVNEKFGIESFSAYSFSIHTLVIASQFIGAITSIFYPILKRSECNLAYLYSTLDKSSSLLSAILLLTYYPAVILILLFYQKYLIMLDYLIFVYPLFIFQCKSNLLIVNMYKVKGEIYRLITVTAIAIVIHLMFVFIAYYMFKNVTAIAIATLIAYMVWYYGCQIMIEKTEAWNDSDLPVDAVVVALFIIINLGVSSIFPEIYFISVIIAFLLNLIIFAIIYFIFKKQLHKVLLDTQIILKD